MRGWYTTAASGVVQTIVKSKGSLTLSESDFFFWYLSLLNVNIKLDSLWTHLEAMSLSRQYKRTSITQLGLIHTDSLFNAEIGWVWTLVQFKPFGIGLHQAVSVNVTTLAILFSLKTIESLQNGVATHFPSDSFVFNENSITSIIAELSQHWRWCLV